MLETDFDLFFFGYRFYKNKEKCKLVIIIKFKLLMTYSIGTFCNIHFDSKKFNSMASQKQFTFS